MTFVIVPDSLSYAINQRLDELIAETPDAAKCRDDLYRQMLLIFDQYGELPPCHLERFEPED